MRRFIGNIFLSSLFICFFLVGSAGKYDKGYSEGYSAGYNIGLDDGYHSGFDTGYNEGYKKAVADSKETINLSEDSDPQSDLAKDSELIEV